VKLGGKVTLVDALYSRGSKIWLSIVKLYGFIHEIRCCLWVKKIRFLGRWKTSKRKLKFDWARWGQVI
jgi:hypothetical protein